jgi:hypothetical protein
MPRRVLFISGLALSLVASTPAQDDPVLRARAQRATAQGLADGDLPPVPRGIIEPPPLPPPEAHVKDTRKASRAKAKGRKGKATRKKGHAAATRSKTPVKGKGK